MYPILFEHNGFVISSYGLMLMIAFVLCNYLLKRYLMSINVNGEIADDLIFYAAFGGIIGAKGSLLKKLLLPENNEIKFLPLSSLAELYREKPEKIICEKIDKNWIEINTEQEFAKQVASPLA